MATRRKSKDSPCVRIGTKRSDLRCKCPEGDIWASPFEYDIYDAIRADSRYIVRRAGECDAVRYNTAVKQGLCPQCGHDEVVQVRVYTPDLYVYRAAPDSTGGQGFYLETKGYFPGPKRNLFRAVHAQRSDIDLRIVAQADHWVTKGKTRLTDWAKRYRIKLHIWDGTLPEEW